MRQATHDTGWMVGNTGQLLGFSLGYDYCSEHEHGNPFLQRKMGITQKKFPIGVEDRAMTKVPEKLGFVKYDYLSKDKRFKKSMPSALLFCTSATDYETNPPTIGLELAKWLDVNFFVDCFADTKWYKPDRHDIQCVWSETGGFAINVRGAENVERLEALHLAMGNCKVSLAAGTITGFLRTSWSLVFNDNISEEQKALVKNADQAHFDLYQSLEDTGLEKTLTSRGKRWYALSPSLRNSDESELLVYLNPQEQQKYRSGWFTIPELMAWADNLGPVLLDEKLDAIFKTLDRDFGITLLNGLEAQGITLRVHHVPVWADAHKTVPAVRLLISKKSEDLMSDGVYSLADLDQYLVKGREIAARKAANLAESLELATVLLPGIKS